MWRKGNTVAPLAGMHIDIATMENSMENSLKKKNKPSNKTTMLLFSHSVMSNSLRPHGLKHTRLPCPSISHEACSSSCPLSQ